MFLILKNCINKSPSILFSNTKTRCTFNFTHCAWNVYWHILFFCQGASTNTLFCEEVHFFVGGGEHWSSFPNRCIYFLKGECFNLLFITGSQFRRSSTRKLELWFVLTRKLLFWTATGAGAGLLRSKPPVNNTKEQICMTLALTWVTWKLWNVFLFYWTHKKIMTIICDNGGLMKHALMISRD
jgi:hypothetical protein